MKAHMIIALLLLASVLFGCKKEQPTETPRLDYGSYESSTFIESGPADRGIDIQSAGGFLRITLTPTGDFTAQLFIPDTLSCSYPKGLTAYAGRFALCGDSIGFSPTTGFFIQAIRWDGQRMQLETYDVPPRGQPFKIILSKFLR